MGANIHQQSLIPPIPSLTQTQRVLRSLLLLLLLPNTLSLSTTLNTLSSALGRVTQSLRSTRHRITESLSRTASCVS